MKCKTLLSLFQNSSFIPFKSPFLYKSTSRIYWPFLTPSLLPPPPHDIIVWEQVFKLRFYDTYGN